MNVYRNQKYPRRGEIYYIKKGNSTTTGSEIWSNRHAVIVSNNNINQHSNVVQVVYITTQQKSKIPLHVDISTKHINRIALCEQIAPVDKSRITEYKGHLSATEMRKISKACAYNINAPCSV